MGWSIGYDTRHKRDIGYGVPATCDHPSCNKDIDRGLSYVCGNDVYGGERGCGLFFCEEHLNHKSLCERCKQHKPHFDLKPDVKDWINWKLTDESWAQWREENPDEVASLQTQIECKEVE